MFSSVRLGLNAELAVDKVVESGFSSLPERIFNKVGSVDNMPIGVATGALGVRLWKSVFADGAGIVGRVTGTDGTVVGVVVPSLIDGAVIAGVVTVGTAVAVAAGGH